MHTPMSVSTMPPLTLEVSHRLNRTVLRMLSQCCWLHIKPVCLHAPAAVTASPPQVQCPVINCALDSWCTTSNKSCCAYINLQIMLFFDQFLYSKGLEGQYTLVYGSALGAHRNNTVLAHTTDVDFAFTPKAAQVLEQNATRQELWRHGYSLWADKT